MLVCDWCHETTDVLLGIQFEMAPGEDEKETILVPYDLCEKCRQDAAETIRQALFELMEKKKAARVPIPE